MFSAHCIVSPVPLYTCRSLAASFVALFSMLSSSQLMAQSQWSNGTGGAIYYNGGNVGIGTANPSGALDVAIPNTHGVFLGSPGVQSYVQFTNGLIESVGNAMVFRGTNRFGQQGIPIAFGTGSTNTATPTQLYLQTSSGHVGIGTSSPQYALTVNGTIGAKEVIVTTSIADYVFNPDYRLTPLTEIDAYIQKHHHLSDIPSEAEVQEKGVSVGEMQAKLLAKIEELTLHMIQAEKRNNELAQQNQELQERMTRLEADSTSSTSKVEAK